MNGLKLEEIKEIIKTKQFDKFYRSEEIQKKYDLEKDETIKRLKKELQQESKDKRRRWVVRKNDYFYHFEKGLEHWVLWDTHADKDWEKTAKDFKRWKYGNAYWHKSIVAEWTNPPELRSVDVPHIHLIKLLKK